MTKYTNFENIDLYIQNVEGYRLKLDLQSFLQLEFIETVTPYFGYLEYELQGLLQGKYLYPGKIQFNQQNLHPLLYYYYNEGKENGVLKLYENYVLETPILEIIDKVRFAKTVLKNVFFIGYQLETTPDGQPIQIAHNMYFMDYENKELI